MTGTKTRDEDGFTTVNVKMPKSHWAALITIALTAVGGVGWSASNAKKLEEQDPPVSREWARKLSEDIADMKKDMGTVTRHDERIQNIIARLDKIDDSLDELKRRQ